MAKYLYVAGSAAGRTIVDPGNGFSPCAGHWDVSTVEPDGVLVIRGAYTASGLGIRCAANVFTGASSYHTRIGAVDGNLDVTIPATSSGFFEDLVNSDSLADGDEFTMELVLVGAHGNSIDWLGTVLAMENAIDNRCQTIAASPGEPRGPSQTLFFATGGDPDSVPAEIDSRWSFRGDRGELTNLMFYLFFNKINGASTFTLRVDGVDGNNTVTIPGNSTGRFEDTTNSDAAAGDGEDFDFELITGADAMGDNMTYTAGSILWDVVGNRPWVGRSRNLIAGHPFGTTQYFPLEGSASDAWNGSTTESDAQVPARFPLIARNLYARANASSLNGATVLTFRVNGADSALALTVPASSTGQFEDTTDEVFVDTGDDIDLEFAMAGTGGLVEITPHKLEQQQPDDMSWYPSDPPAMQRIVEVLAY